MLLRRAKIALQRLRFRGSAPYWEARYAHGGTSGAGSYGEQASYKATFLSSFVTDEGVESVIEFGCGDGNQLELANYPRYLGLDVSQKAIELCLARFADDRTKSFVLYAPEQFSDPANFLQAELALSLDVVYHLIEDDVFERYMRHLFNAATRFVAVYATDEELSRQAGHVRHRAFSRWVARNTTWKVIHTQQRPNDEYQDFVVFAPATSIM